MTPLRQHMLAALQLSGKSERTQDSYLREVRLLAQFYHKAPDRISEQELQHYFLYRTNVDGLAPASMRLCSSGLRFFYQHVLQRDWHTLALMRAQTTHRLPAVLRVEEVRRLLAAATPLHNQVYFTTLYSLGLRLHAALFLQVSDIDGQRLQVQVHRGKGAKDRYVPLPADTLTLLRTSWKTHRHPTWLFPATGRNHSQGPTAAFPMSRSSVQGAFRTAKYRAGITKMGVASPTLRHSYATHLLEAGVNPRLLQRYLGHTQLETTMLSLHLTPQRAGRCLRAPQRSHARAPAMTTLQDIFITFAPEYLECYPTLPTSHRKVISAIQQCHSGYYGHSLYQCHSCGKQHRVHHSCGNRHCPQCQQHTTQQWLQHHLDQQLPGPHFLLTFTVPETLRAFIRSHQRLAYHALLQASATALKRLAKDARFIGTALPGFTGVLHTWGRQFQYHPHIHSIVPGGGLSADRSAWLPSRANFFVPVKALSPIYRALFKEDMCQAGLLEHIDPQVWSIPWNVHSQANHHGHSAFTYLAPYVCKVAISNQRLVGLKDRTVTFTYRQVGSARLRTTPLAVMEFLRRFLQHVLPHGFMKVRHVGFLHASCAIPPATIRLLIVQARPSDGPPPPRTPPPPRAARCPTCGAPMRVVMRLWTSPRDFVDTS